MLLLEYFKIGLNIGKICIYCIYKVALYNYLLANGINLRVLWSFAPSGFFVP